MYQEYHKSLECLVAILGVVKERAVTINANPKNTAYRGFYFLYKLCFSMHYMRYNATLFQIRYAVIGATCLPYAFNTPATQSISLSLHSGEMAT